MSQLEAVRRYHLEGPDLGPIIDYKYFAKNSADIPSGEAKTEEEAVTVEAPRTHLQTLVFNQGEEPANYEPAISQKNNQPAKGGKVRLEKLNPEDAKLLELLFPESVK